MTYRALPKPSKDNQQIREYVDAAQRGLKSQLIMHTKKGWSIKRADAKRASAIFSTKKEAISRAKAIAKNQNSTFHIIDR